MGVKKAICLGGGRFGEGDKRENEEVEEKGRDLSVMPLHIIMIGRRDFVSLSRYAEQAASPATESFFGGYEGSKLNNKTGVNDMVANSALFSF